LQLIETAKQNVSKILNHSVKLQENERFVVIYDKQCELTEILALAYQAYRDDCLFLNFDESNPMDIRNLIETELNEGDLVVLIQTTGFRLEEYRFRLTLFQR
jgi:aminopeptidase